jgi:hypothetical protein
MRNDLKLYSKVKKLIHHQFHKHGHKLKDKLYLKILFYIKFGYRLDLKNPKTYNEKCQWLKLNYRNKDLIPLVDKFEVKKIVSDKIGEDFVVKNYGVWNSFDEISFDKLPNQFVIKTTHDSSGAIICKDKSKFNYEKVKAIVERNLIKNAYLPVREWAYNYVKPRIIVDELIDTTGEEGLMDFKFFCFDGEPKLVVVERERIGKKVKADFYDMNCNHLDITQGGTQSGEILNKTEDFETMVSFAKILSVNIPHIRIDFFYTNKNIYFAEFTMYQHGGIQRFHPEKWDRILGDWIDLSKIKK